MNPEVPESIKESTTPQDPPATPSGPQPTPTAFMVLQGTFDEMKTWFPAGLPHEGGIYGLLCKTAPMVGTDPDGVERMQVELTLVKVAQVSNVARPSALVMPDGKAIFPGRKH